MKLSRVALICILHTLSCLTCGQTPLDDVRERLKQIPELQALKNAAASTRVSPAPNLRRALQTPVTSMLLGDSWAAFAFLAYGLPSAPSGYCSDVSVTQTIVNAGVGGSTAAQWAAGSCTGLGNCDIDTLDFSGVDNVWVTIGGNDFLGNNCAPISGVGDSLRTVINAIRAKNSAIKILLTGYGMPSAELGGGCTLSAIANIEASVNDEMAALDLEIDQVEYVNILELFGGTISPPGLSSGTFYADNIHLNEAGYDVFYAESTIKSFFCSPDCTAPSSAPTAFCTSGSSTSSPSISPSQQPTNAPSLPTPQPTSAPSPPPTQQPTKAPNVPSGFFDNVNNIYIVAAGGGGGLLVLATLALVLLRRNRGQPGSVQPKP